MMSWVPAALILIASGAASAGDEEEQVVEPGEDDVEIIDDGSAEPPGDAGEPLGLRRTLGRFHPPLVHFGVAWAVLVFPFALARVLRPGLGRADLAVVAAAVAGGAVSALTGLLHAPDLESAPGMHGTIELHETMALVTLGVLAAALVLRMVLERRWMKPLAIAYAAAGAIALGLVLYVGHLGGEITFGKDFLPFP